MRSTDQMRGFSGLSLPRTMKTRPKENLAKIYKEALNLPLTDPSHLTSSKSVEDAADWLKEKPDSVDLDTHHFAILDQRTGSNGAIVICKIGEMNLKGDKLDYLRFDAAEAALHLGRMEYGTWEGSIPDGTKTAKIEY